MEVKGGEKQLVHVPIGKQHYTMQTNAEVRLGQHTTCAIVDRPTHTYQAELQPMAIITTPPAHPALAMAFGRASTPRPIDVITTLKTALGFEQDPSSPVVRELTLSSSRLRFCLTMKQHNILYKHMRVNTCYIIPTNEIYASLTKLY